MTIVKWVLWNVYFVVVYEEYKVEGRVQNMCSLWEYYMKDSYNISTANTSLQLS